MREKSGAVCPYAGVALSRLRSMMAGLGVNVPAKKTQFHVYMDQAGSKLA
jgi:hypothetical protein